MQNTPRANRIHIAFFGKTNMGKSTLINTFTNQQVALTSTERGTTTDPVYKAIEISGIGPCVIIDTAGIDDDTVLGEKRVERTRKIMDKTDIAVLMIREECVDIEVEWFKEFMRRKMPVITVINKGDFQVSHNTQKTLFETHPKMKFEKIKEEFDVQPIEVNAKTGEGIQRLYASLQEVYKTFEKESSICGDLVTEGDVVLLVMPQDIQAPKGRLILPQAQTIRELLDRQCIVQCVTNKMFDRSLELMRTPPKLIITDSQLFAEIALRTPKGSKLTSFSVLFSKYKGDIDEFLKGARALKSLDTKAKILIAEACTHKPLEEDIGRVKLPRLLKKKLGIVNDPTIVAGNDFPTDLKDFDVIIHCGACMFNRRHVMSRVARAKEQNVLITNYGLAIAALNGILDDLVY